MEIRNAVAYCRFSSDNQRTESIDAQVRAIKEYCKKKRYVLTHVYRDEALSGTSDSREEFQQMISDSSKGEFSYVIVHKLDRFARNRYDSAIYRKKLKDNGVVLLSVLENLDDSPESIILESVLEGMNEYYSKNLAREVRKGLNENALKCEHNGGIPPLGYDVIDRHYVINEREAESVRLIFKLYSENYGYRLIISELNKRGYKTKSGHDFSNNSIHDILINEKYRGVYVWNKRKSKKDGNRSYKDDKDIIRIEGGMPRIVDDDTYYKVQEKLKTRVKPRMNSRHDYLLTGKIECGCCGHAYCGYSSYRTKTGKRTYNYCCTGRKNSKSCRNKLVNAGKLESIVMDVIRERFLNDEAIDSIAEMMDVYIRPNENDDSGNKILKLKRKISGIEAKQNRLLDLYLDDSMSIENLNSKTEELKKEKESLERQLGDIESREHLDYSIEDIRAFLNDMKGKLDETDPKIKRTLIEAFVYKITVNEEDIEITLYLDNFVSQNCAKIGGGESIRNIPMFPIKVPPITRKQIRDYSTE